VWFPNYAGDVVERAKELRSRAERPIGFEVISAPADPAKLEELRHAGCRRAVRWLPSGGLSVVEPAFERWESAIAEFTGEA
jgi:hypothetical protein